MPYIDLNKIKTENHWTNRIKDGVKRFGRKAKEKVVGAVEYVKDNPEAAATLLAAGGAAFGAISKLTKGVIRHVNLRQERYNKERYVYDHSLNMYLHTKRKLKNKDVANINRLRKQGLSKSEAMMKLNLLKK